MQRVYPRYCGPDQLRTLQSIFDHVWIELRSNGTFSGPTEPQTIHGKIAHRVMGYEIGRQVMRYADNHQMTDSEITNAVVSRMSITYRLESDSGGQVALQKPDVARRQMSARTPTVVRKEVTSHYL
jgi:hypothetical protein